MLIYCGVGRGFLEPATAYFVANDFRISCECFDILDACMSWVRALYIVYQLFARNQYSTALVVNAEFNIYECGYPGIMKVHSLAGLQNTLPAYTIGEAATATVLKKSASDWNFRFRSNTAALPLCELTRVAGRQMLRFVQDTYPEPRAFQKWFPHLATAKPYIHAAETLGLNGKMYTKTFARYGNVVSASIPVGLVTAAAEGEIKRGDRVVLCPISAGMSMALVDFTY